MAHTPAVAVVCRLELNSKALTTLILVKVLVVAFRQNSYTHKHNSICAKPGHLAHTHTHTGRVKG